VRLAGSMPALRWRSYPGARRGAWDGGEIRLQRYRAEPNQKEKKKKNSEQLVATLDKKRKRIKRKQTLKRRDALDG